MKATISPGAILIKDATSLPPKLQFESEPCVPGWSLVKDFDGYGLDREIREKGWTFFWHVQESLFLSRTTGLPKPEARKSEPARRLAVVSVPSL